LNRSLSLAQGYALKTPTTKTPHSPFCLHTLAWKEKAFYSKEWGEFFLLYNEVRNAADPEETLMRSWDPPIKLPLIRENGTGINWSATSLLLNNLTTKRCLQLRLIYSEVLNLIITLPKAE